MNSLLAQESFRLILDALHDGVAIYDREGILLWVNEKVCQMFALPRTELIGRNVRDIVALPNLQSLVTEEVNGRPRTATGTYSARIEDYVSPGYLVFANGRQVLYTGITVPDEHGDLVYAIYTLRDVTDLNEARKKIGELQQLTALYQDQLRTLHTRVLGRDIVYRSEIMRKILERTLKLARLDGNILLMGETGVGKNVLAQYIHVMSRRASGPFIHVNCASLPESLVEAELFGYADGAFTGAARKGRRGLIELGQSGTVFLDEIGDMPLGMQAKLLTVLEDKVVRRIGGEQWINVDVRFVAATNKNPETTLQQKSLREDLYYRLAENQIYVPPLRERPEDIPSLIEQTLTEFNHKNGTHLTFHDALTTHLQSLPFPGNVRELKNLVLQIVSEVGTETSEINWSMLPPDLMRVLVRQDRLPNAAPLAHPQLDDKRAQEQQHLRALCEQYQGDVYAIASTLGVHRTTVVRKLREYGIVYARKNASRSSLSASFLPSKIVRHYSCADDNGSILPPGEGQDEGKKDR
jgi:PAS domain S-box-containing protein